MSLRGDFELHGKLLAPSGGEGNDCVDTGAFEERELSAQAVPRLAEPSRHFFLNIPFQAGVLLWPHAGIGSHPRVGYTHTIRDT